MDQQYMQAAIIEAKKALEYDEVPVGAVIVYKGEIIARAHNLRETKQSSLAHAENLVIHQANQVLSSWQLNECTLYVTLEPCVMCAGSIIKSRLKRVVFGAYDPKGGAMGSLTNINELEGLNHHVELEGGVLAKETGALLTEFFKQQRDKQIKVKQVTTEEEFKNIKELRYNVFVLEQNVDPELEYDEYDDLGRDDTIHVIAKQGDRVVGGIRLLLKDKTIKVGRVVVDKSMRKHKIGSKLMAYADRFALNNGYNELQLGAQLTAIPFYEHCGYESYGDIFLDAEIEHKMMKKSVR